MRLPFLTGLNGLPQLPRLRIAHQLSLLIAAAVVLAVLVVGALSVFNLHSGFIDYLRLRDDEQLTRFVKLLERRASADPSMQWLRNDREAHRQLMDEFNGRPRGRRSPRPEDGTGGAGEPRSDRGGGGGPPGDPGRPPPNDAPPRPPAELNAQLGAGTLSERLVIRDAQGQWLAGRAQPQGARHTVRAVKVDGVDVAWVDLVAEPEPEGMDVRFLQRQYTGLAVAGFGTIALSVLAAWWVASRWSQPLQALQRASRDIASGQRPRRLKPTGAREIAQLMEDVNSMAAGLMRLEDARRIWIAQISHELRTPLAVLRGEIESIEDGARQPTPAVMASLRDEVLQLNRLVNDLHTLSVAELDGMHCEFTDGDAHSTLLRVSQRFEARAQQAGLQLQLPRQDGPPIAVRWDFGRIEQLLGNLIANSLRYTDAPGVVLLNWHQQGQALVLTVEDSAPSVSAADLPQLFEPLFRTDRARQRGGEHGSGLGLSIVRSIVQAHRGTVSASLSPRGGLRVCVRLPLQAESDAP